MEFHFVFWKKQNLTKSSILSKVSFYPEKLSRLSEKFHFPNFPKFALFFLFLMDFPQISNIFWQNTQIWKVPFCKFRKFFDRKFHFIPKNLVRFWDPKVPFYRGSILPWDPCTFKWSKTVENDHFFYKTSTSERDL